MFCTFCKSKELLIRHPDHDAFYCETCEKSYSTHELESAQNESARPPAPTNRIQQFQALCRYFGISEENRGVVLDIWTRGGQQPRPRTNIGPAPTPPTKPLRIRLAANEVDVPTGQKKN